MITSTTAFIESSRVLNSEYIVRRYFGMGSILRYAFFTIPSVPSLAQNKLII